MSYIETLDYLFKVVLANKLTLAITMKECLNEFKHLDVSTIYNDYIEAHILKDVGVHENIVGANTERITDGKMTTLMSYSMRNYQIQNIRLVSLLMQKHKV